MCGSSVKRTRPEGRQNGKRLFDTPKACEMGKYDLHETKCGGADG